MHAAVDHWEVEGTWLHEAHTCANSVVRRAVTRLSWSSLRRALRVDFFPTMVVNLMWVASTRLGA